MHRTVISKIIDDRHLNSIIILLYLCSRKSKTEIYRSISLNLRLPYKLQVLEKEEIITMERAARDK